MARRHSALGAMICRAEPYFLGSSRAVVGEYFRLSCGAPWPQEGTIHSAQRVYALAVLAWVSWGSWTACSAQYTDANRRIYLLPREAALGRSNMVMSRDGGPNTSPANLTLDSTSELQLGYAGYFSNTYSSTLLSYVCDLGSLGAVGVSGDYLYVPGIYDTRDLQVDGTGLPVYDPALVKQVTASEIYLHLAYGKGWNVRRVRLDGGVGLNVLLRRLVDWTGYGVGLDLAAAAGFPRTGIRLGLLMENVTTTYMNWSDGYSENASPHLRFGAGWRRDLPYIYGALQITYVTPDLLSNEGANATTFLTGSDSSEAPRQLKLNEDPQMVFYGNYGIEYTVARIVGLRLGLEGLRQVTFGAGLALFHQRLLVDFAWLTHELGGSYSASVGWRWP